MTNETNKPSQQDLFNRFVNIYHELATLNLDIKALTEDFKDLYPDEKLTTIKAVARAKAEESLGTKLEKGKEFEEIAEIFVK